METFSGSGGELRTPRRAAHVSSNCWRDVHPGKGGGGGGKQVSDVRNVKSGMNALARFSMKSLFSFPYVSMSDIYYLYLLKNLYRKSN